MKKTPLHWQIIIGLCLGVVWAVASSYWGWSSFTILWIKPWGDIFINLLKLIAVPLVLFSIIKGIAGLSDIKRLGRIGIKTLLIYVCTTVFAVSIGLLAVNVIKPGNFLSEEQRLENREDYENWVAQTKGVELLDNKQIAESDYEEKKNGQNNVIADKLDKASQAKSRGPLQFLKDMVPSNIFFALNDNSLMLQVIFFAIFFGITLLLIEESKAGSVIDFVDGANEVFLKMVDITMKGAPFFVFALLAGKLSEITGDNPENLWGVFKGLGVYSLTVIIGLSFIIFVVYPTIYLLINHSKTIFRQKGNNIFIAFAKKYIGFFTAISPAQMLAFSTSSSAATLPVTIECVQDRLGVSKEVSSFVLPVGATVNMDGTSLYQAVAVVFLAQFHMVDLSLGQQLTIVLTATLASIGSAAVPSAGLVMLIIVLESVGLNPAWIAIVFPVDRILDMCRTVVNVTGDATVASVINRMESKNIEYHISNSEISNT